MPQNNTDASDVPDEHTANSRLATIETRFVSSDECDCDKN
jgi:hypothetical protein